MDMELSRTQFTEAGIFSVFTVDKDNPEWAMHNFFEQTLEHAYESDIAMNSSIAGKPDWYPKIPNGIYTCVRGMHRLHGMTEDFETFEITGVPAHTGLLFHCGNFNKDSEGCVLVGMGKQVNGPDEMITGSRIAFVKFMNLQEGCDSFQLTVK